MINEFVRMTAFEKQCNNIGLNEENIQEIENIIIENPTAGDVIEGTGGMRKLRYALQNKGKSGGARIIYINYLTYHKSYLIAVFQKSEIKNLSKAERNNLKALSKKLGNELKKGS